MSGEEWTHVRLVLEIARTGSFRAAAQALGMDQGTASRRIKLLEQSAGVPLFTRKTSGATATDAGRRLIAAAEIAAEGMGRFQRTLRGLATEADHVTVSAPEGIASYLLGPIIVGVGEAHHPLPIGRKAQQLPPIELAPPDAAHADVEILLLGRGEDVPRPPETKIRHVGQMRFVPVAGRRYLSVHGMLETFSDLRQHHLLNHGLYQYDPGLLPWNAIVADHRAGVRLTAPTSSALHRPIVAGAGVSLMPDFSSVVDPEVVVLAMKAPVMSIEIWIAADTEPLRRANVRTVFDTLGQMFTQSPWFSPGR
jgi:DNA-binding transcriptional LysR family regulator